MADEKNIFELRWTAWEITGECNLDCIHCRSAGGGPDALSTSGYKRLIDDTAAFSKPVVVLSGGEPLMRKDVFEIAEYGTSRGLRMALATNGVLVTSEIAKRIKESGIKIVSLSLDGATRAVHDDFRRQAGAFDGAVRAARIFRDEGISFLINSSFTKKNQHAIKYTRDYAKELGAKAWYMFMVVPTGRAGEIADELIDRETYEEILRWHYEAEKAEKDMLMRPTCAPQYYRIFEEMNRETGDKLERRTLSFSTGGSKGCVAAQSICFIHRSGDVSPCSYMPLVAGNVKDTPLAEIWNDSELFKGIRDVDSYHGDCGICEYRRRCGGCRTRALAATGDHLAKDPLCAFVPKRAPGEDAE